MGPPPPWIGGEGGRGATAAAFHAGAALAALHPVAVGRRPGVPLGLLRDRLALEAAQATAGLEGRPTTAAALRDQVHLLRAGERPGPAGAVFELWRTAVTRRPDAAEQNPLLPPTIGEALADRSDELRDLPPLSRLAETLARALDAAPGRDIAALVAAEAALAAALGHARPTPVLGTSFRRRDLSLRGAELEEACALAVARGALKAMRLAADLERRASRLRAIVPRLRGRAAPAAVELMLSEDAVAPSIALAPRVRGRTEKMSDRAARRLCERLVALGAIRELTGRNTFRLYGL